MSRNLLLAQVVGVKDQNIIYPSCKYCYSKVYSQGEGDETQWRCIKCKAQFPECDVAHRFRLHLTVTDNTTYCDVSVFGSNLEQMFGCTAFQFKRYLNQHVDTCDFLSSSLEDVFMGRLFLFGFKTSPIKKRSSVTRYNRPVSLSTVLQYSHPRHAGTHHSDHLHTPSLVAYQMIPAPSSLTSTPPPTVLKAMRGKIQATIRELGGEVEASNPQREACASHSQREARPTFARPLLLDTPVCREGRANFSTISDGQTSVLLSCDKDSSSFTDNQTRDKDHSESYLVNRSSHSHFNLTKNSILDSGKFTDNFSGMDFESTFYEDSTAESDCLENESRYFHKDNIRVRENDCDNYESFRSVELARSNSLNNESQYRLETSELSLILPNTSSTSTYLTTSRTQSSVGNTTRTQSSVGNTTRTQSSVGTCVLEKSSLMMSRNDSKLHELPQIHEELITDIHHDDIHYSMFEDTFHPNETREESNHHSQLTESNQHSHLTESHQHSQLTESHQPSPGCRAPSTGRGGHTRLTDDSSSASDSDSFLLLACQAEPSQDRPSQDRPNQDRPNHGQPDGHMSAKHSSHNVDYNEHIDEAEYMEDGREGDEWEGEMGQEEEGWEEEGEEEGTDCSSDQALSFRSHVTTVDAATDEDMPYSESLDAFLNEMSFSEEIEFKDERKSRRGRDGDAEEEESGAIEETQEERDGGQEEGSREGEEESGAIEETQEERDEEEEGNTEGEEESAIEETQEERDGGQEEGSTEGEEESAIEETQEEENEEEEGNREGEEESVIEETQEEETDGEVEEGTGEQREEQERVEEQEEEENEEKESSMEEEEVEEGELMSQLPMSEELFSTQEEEEEHIANTATPDSPIPDSLTPQSPIPATPDPPPAPSPIPRSPSAHSPIPFSPDMFSGTAELFSSYSESMVSDHHPSHVEMSYHRPPLHPLPLNVSRPGHKPRRKSVHFAGSLVNVETIAVIDKQMRTPLPVMVRRRSCLISADTSPYLLSQSLFSPSPQIPTTPLRRPPPSLHRSSLLSQSLFSPSPEVHNTRQRFVNPNLHSTPVRAIRPRTGQENSPNNGPGNSLNNSPNNSLNNSPNNSLNNSHDYNEQCFSSSSVELFSGSQDLFSDSSWT